ncbi:MAG: cell envelope integrity protein CreD [Tahibacter sp.]
MATFTPSITHKVLGIGLLALLMLLPLAQVQSLIAERSGLHREAVAQIAQRWGAAQVMGGPVLRAIVPVRTRVDAAWRVDEDAEITLADQLDIVARLEPEIRRYGIYAAPVYKAQIDITAHFSAADLANLRRTVGVHADQVEVRLPLSDAHGLREVNAVHVNGVERQLQAGGDLLGLRSIAIPVDISTMEKMDVDIRLQLAGTESLQILPLARTSTLHIAAPWADPSFTGAFLPATHAVTTDGFTAQWQVLELNRAYGQQWNEHEVDRSAIDASAFGVALYQPAGVYQQNERAGKYGILFVALSFIAFFLFEVLRRLRVHPLQYLLVGLALSTFYLVLLALSEQIGFGAAYAVAATAVVLMIGGYAGAVLATRGAGLWLGSVLAVVYALLYGLVVSEQYSLLIGACALLIVVALLMYLTRRVDWYAYSRSTLSPVTESP